MKYLPIKRHKIVTIQWNFIADTLKKDVDSNLTANYL